MEKTALIRGTIVALTWFMREKPYEEIPGQQVPIKMWTHGVPVEDAAVAQLQRVAALPFVYKWLAVMPDVHLGLGATVGSVIPTRNVLIPAAVGVDIGCGMIAVRTSLTATDLPDNLSGVRAAIERAIPHGRTHNGQRGDRGAWRKVPKKVAAAWGSLDARYGHIHSKHSRIGRGPTAEHLGTLGTGNHFIEVCLDEAQRVWVMLHSGSRGVGNRIGRYFISAAKRDMVRWFIQLPDEELAYIPDGSPLFADYVDALGWAQDYAALNRRLMIDASLAAMQNDPGLPPFRAHIQVVDCHHNYVAREHHYGEDVYVTRKGAVRAQRGDLAIIPGSMGERTMIVRGLGAQESFHSCSHGAGRLMSRTEARRQFTVEDHEHATRNVECRKDARVIDETPGAYKPLDDVMAAQEDLVEVVHTLRQVVCVKG